jgi:threonine synthase
MEGAGLLAQTEGMFCCPEAGATVAAFIGLSREGWIGKRERVVLFNTGSGHKYSHLWVE